MCDRCEKERDPAKDKDGKYLKQDLEKKQADHKIATEKAIKTLKPYIKEICQDQVKIGMKKIEDRLERDINAFLVGPVQKSMDSFRGEVTRICGKIKDDMASYGEITIHSEGIANSIKTLFERIGALEYHMNKIDGKTMHDCMVEMANKPPKKE